MGLPGDFVLWVLAFNRFSCTHVSSPGKILDDAFDFRILQLCARHDVLVVVAREILHPRLILAKASPVISNCLLCL